MTANYITKGYVTSSQSQSDVDTEKELTSDVDWMTTLSNNVSFKYLHQNPYHKPVDMASSSTKRKPLSAGEVELIMNGFVYHIN